jgi:predicted transposase/invertase (TIGR01784 family)
MKKPPLSPCNDAIFKIIFGDAQDTGSLTGFLQSTLTLPVTDYADVTLIDTHLKRGEPEDKLCILDVMVKTPTGKIIDIEVQVTEQQYMRERIVFYLSRMVAGQIGRGEPYKNIKRSICILICNHELITENRNYHNCYRLYDPRTGSEFTDLLEVHTLELPKLPPDDGSRLWDWLKFLNAKTEEELTMLAQKNPQVGKAVAKLMVLSEDERLRLIAESRDKLHRDIITNEYAIRENIARNLLQFGDPVTKIVQVSGLSIEEVKEIQLEWQINGNGNHV